MLPVRRAPALGAIVVGTRLIVLATLSVRRTELEAFREFERAAAAILARHGAVFERVLVHRSEAVGGEPAPWIETHVLRFPDAESLAAYRADPELLALASVRARAVLHTSIALADDAPLYR